MERNLEDIFVPVFGSRKNIASVPLCWKELLSCLNFPPYWVYFYSKKKSQLLSVYICLLRIYFVTLRNEKPFSPFLPVNREPMREPSSLEYDIKTYYENEKIYSLPIIPQNHCGVLSFVTSCARKGFAHCSSVLSGWAQREGANRTRRGFTPLWVEAQPKEGLNQRWPCQRRLAKLARIAQEDAQNGESSQEEVVVHVRKNLQRTEFD